MFGRIISIDWSGAGSETEGVDLRVVTHDTATGVSAAVNRQVGKRTYQSWSRDACRSWLIEQLRGETPTLVALDFGFGMPWGADRAVFGVSGWRDMLRAVADQYRKQGTARATALAVNDEERFAGHGPYRFDDSRADFRFYADHDVAYYRLTELVAPQAISQWYLGSGGTVGFHTITGLAAIQHLIEWREAGEIDFRVWPHEVLKPDGSGHVLVESYPAICRPPDDATAEWWGPCRADDDHQRDAWKVLQYIVAARKDGTLPRAFEIPELRFGRIKDVGFWEQIQFEGCIFGLR